MSTVVYRDRTVFQVIATRGSPGTILPNPSGNNGKLVGVSANKYALVSASSGGSLAVGHTLFVDAVNGNDATGTSGNASLPYLTLAAAITDAVSGDLVSAGPGTFVDSFLIDGVGLNLANGTFLTQSGAPIFDDTSVAKTAHLSGEGEWDFGDGAIVVGRTSSKLTMKARRLTANASNFAVRQTAGTIYQDAQDLDSVQGYVWWGGGKYVGNFLNVTCSAGDYALINLTPGDATGGFDADRDDFHFHAHKISSSNDTGSGLLTILTGNVNARAWLIANEIENTNVQNALIAFGGCKLYVIAEKTKGTIAANQGGGEFFLTTQKHNGRFINTDATYADVSIGTLDDTGLADDYIIAIDDGTTIISDMNFTATVAKGVNVTGGTLRLVNCVIDVSAITGESAISVSGGTLVLNGCTLTPASGQSAINQSGGTVSYCPSEVPPGGTNGQALVKTSNSDYATGWASVTGTGTVTSVGLAGTANQLTVTGTSPITGSGSWTISFPTGGVTLPATTTGTFSGNLTGNASGSAGSVAAANITGTTLASGVTASSLLSAAGGAFGTAAYTAATAYQPVAAALTSWAAVTRASGFDTFTTTPTSANLKALITDETGSGALVFGTAPTIAGGSITALTALAVRSTGAAFDLTIASSEVFTAGRALSIVMGDAARTLTLTANASIGGTHSGTSSGTNTGDQTSVSGNAGTATALATPRAINGVNFDGTAAITITAAAGTLSGSTLAAGVTGSSLTSLGTVVTGVWNGTALVAAYLPALNAITAPTGDLSLNSHKITSLTTGTADTDAVNVGQLNAAVAALDEKAECAAATATALAAATYANGSSGVGATLTLTVSAVLVIDGYTPALNDRLLIKSQASAFQNGIYTLTTVGVLGVTQAVLTRATDFDQVADNLDGAITFISNGSTNGNTRWQCSTTGTITFGSTNINWSQFSGAIYSADETTLHLSGTTFSLIALGTPASGVGTNLTGIPIGTGISGLGTSVAAALAKAADGSVEDAIGFRGIPNNSKSADYTTVLSDVGKMIYHPAADTTSRTYTIDSHANVSWPDGACIGFDNAHGAGSITIAITTDTMELVGAAGSTGSRTLASGGRAFAWYDRGTHRWRISGSAELT